jgi:hypothetical protein
MRLLTLLAADRVLEAVHQFLDALPPVAVLEILEGRPQPANRGDFVVDFLGRHRHENRAGDPLEFLGRGVELVGRLP